MTENTYRMMCVCVCFFRWLCRGCILQALACGWFVSFSNAREEQRATRRAGCDVRLLLLLFCGVFYFLCWPTLFFCVCSCLVLVDVCRLFTSSLLAISYARIFRHKDIAIGRPTPRFLGQPLFCQANNRTVFQRCMRAGTSGRKLMLCNPIDSCGWRWLPVYPRRVCGCLSLALYPPLA